MWCLPLARSPLSARPSSVLPDAPPPAPCRPHRPSRRRSGRAARAAAGGPVRRGPRGRARPRGGALADPAALPSAGCGARPRGRSLRRGRAALAVVAGRRAARHPRRGPMGPRHARLAAGAGARRGPRGALGRAAGPAPGGGSQRRGARPAPGSPLRGRAPAGRVVLGVRRAAAERAGRLAGRWLRRRVRRGPRARPRLATAAVAPPRRAGRHATAAPASRGDRDPAPQGPDLLRPARAALPLRPHAHPRHRGGAARRAGRAPRRAPVAAAPLRRDVALPAAAGRRRAGPAPRRPLPPRGLPPAAGRPGA